MKKSIFPRLAAAGTALFLSAMAAFPALAASPGSLDSVTETAISGRLSDWTVSDPSVSVEILISGGNGPGDGALLKAEPQKTDGSSELSFSCPVVWSALSGTQFTVSANLVSGSSVIPLSGSFLYDKNEKAAKRTDLDEESGQAQEETASALEKGEFLGSFIASGYCNCSKCSGGHNLTYSGTVPKSSHTIAADIGLFPIGTKLFIRDTVYTVEDIGGAALGDRIDIFFDTHEEALAFGLQSVEVYSVR